jgi:hypothetical protein
MQRAMADQLGVSSDAVTSYSIARVRTRLELLGGRASELLKSSLKFAFTEIMNLENDDAVDVEPLPLRRRGVLQVRAPISWR